MGVDVRGQFGFEVVGGQVELVKGEEGAPDKTLIFLARTESAAVRVINRTMQAQNVRVVMVDGDEITGKDGIILPARSFLVTPSFGLNSERGRISIRCIGDPNALLDFASSSAPQPLSTAGLKEVKVRCMPFEDRYPDDDQYDTTMVYELYLKPDPA